MKIELLFAASICALMLSACSSKQLYQNVQENNKRRCEQEFNENARQECLQGTATNYETYTREREQLLKDEGE